MAKIVEDMVAIKLNKIAKDDAPDSQSIITDEKVSVNARAFKTEVEKKGNFRRDVS